MGTELLAILIKPFAHFCLRHSVKLQDLIAVFKDELVLAAKQELEKKGQKVTASRLSVMTGVHRKDIKTLTSGVQEEFGTQNIVSKIIGQWQSSAAFTTKAGKPRVIDAEGAESEFAELVYSVSADLNPYTILFELERVGAVSRTPKGLKLEVDFYMPVEDLESGYRLLAGDIHDLTRSAEENLQAINSPHLHLKTEYDRVPVEALPKVQSWLLKEGSVFHQKVRKFLALHDLDCNAKLKHESSKVGRVVLGSFTYTEKDNE